MTAADRPVTIGTSIMAERDKGGGVATEGVVAIVILVLAIATLDTMSESVEDTDVNDVASLMLHVMLAVSSSSDSPPFSMRDSANVSTRDTGFLGGDDSFFLEEETARSVVQAFRRPRIIMTSLAMTSP
jgi:hypothetical protein